MKTHYILNDTFNGRPISRHRTLTGAVRAKILHARQVTKANGRGAYLTYSITTEDGSFVDRDLYEQACETIAEGAR
jgi:hypothetical protein